MKYNMDREKFYDIIEKICNHDDYSIGLHGIDPLKVGSVDDDSIEIVKNQILEDGLKIFHGRTLLGTVQFENDSLSVKDLLTKYQYGDVKNYLVIALPKVLRNQDNESLFLGSPTYNSMHSELMGTQGYQITSLADAILPDYQDDVSVLSSFFILSSFKILDNNMVEVTFNQKHPAFHEHLVPLELYNEKKKLKMDILSSYGINPNIEEVSVSELEGMHNDISYIINNILLDDEFDMDNFDVNDLSDGKVDIYNSFLLETTKPVKNIDMIFAIDETIVQLARRKFGICLNSDMKLEDNLDNYNKFVL